MGKAKMFGLFADPKKKGSWEKKAERKYQEGQHRRKHAYDPHNQFVDYTMDDILRSIDTTRRMFDD